MSVLDIRYDGSENVTRHRPSGIDFVGMVASLAHTSASVTSFSAGRLPCDMVSAVAEITASDASYSTRSLSAALPSLAAMLAHECGLTLKQHVGRIFEARSGVTDGTNACAGRMNVDINTTSCTTARIEPFPSISYC
eukprot:3775582-Rhodomonas_salina.2